MGVADARAGAVAVAVVVVVVVVVAVIVVVFDFVRTRAGIQPLLSCPDCRRKYSERSVLAEASVAGPPLVL